MKHRVIHIRDLPNYPDAVRVDRTTRWGNPFRVGTDGTRKEVIERFRAYLLSKPKLLAAAKKELRGKTLACWCSPKACHAEVILAVVNSKSLWD